jgi:hypothetical protein
VYSKDYSFLKTPGFTGWAFIQRGLLYITFSRRILRSGFKFLDRFHCYRPLYIKDLFVEVLPVSSLNKVLFSFFYLNQLLLSLGIGRLQRDWTEPVGFVSLHPFGSGDQALSRLLLAGICFLRHSLPASLWQGLPLSLSCDSCRAYQVLLVVLSTNIRRSLTVLENICACLAPLRNGTEPTHDRSTPRREGYHHEVSSLGLVALIS